MATPTPKYAQRIGRLPGVFAILAGHPNGLPLTDLAAQVGAPVDEQGRNLHYLNTPNL
jgi:hypothetical protein